MKNKAELVKEEFKKSVEEVDTLFLDFDGKAVKQLTKRLKQVKQRLACYVDSPELAKEQVLGVPIVKSSSGEDQFKVVLELIEEWNLMDRLAGLSFDTTGENTGLRKGVVARVERHLGRALLWRACRRHSLEVHPKKAAQIVFGDTTSPHWNVFKTVHDNFESFAKDDDHSGIDYDDLEYY